MDYAGFVYYGYRCLLGSSLALPVMIFNLNVDIY